jgi:hypothetical protein
MDYTYNYGGVLPDKWTSGIVEEVCLDIIPRKISSEPELFENNGDVLILFLQFLGEQKYITRHEQLIKTVNKTLKILPTTLSTLPLVPIPFWC